MSETENSKPEDNGQPETEDTAATPQAGAEDTAGETGADASPDDAIVKLTAELDSMRDKLLRALAEAENTRRRAERDVADARSYAVSSFAKDMLDVSDNLSRAVGDISRAFLHIPEHEEVFYEPPPEWNEREKLDKVATETCE